VLLLAVLSAAPATCPSHDAVEAELRDLRVAPHALEQHPYALSQVPGGVQVQIRDPSGAVVGERILSGGPCQALAPTAAVWIAAWVLELDRARVPEPTFSPPRVTLPPPAPEPPTWIELGAEARGTWDRAGAGWGAAVDFSAGPRAEGLGVWAQVFWSASHEQALGPGDARWARDGLAAGPRYSWSRGSLFVEARAVGVIARLSLRGEGYAADASAQGADVGGGAGLRAGWRGSGFAPWLGLSATGWARRSQAALSGASDTATLPQFEVAAAAGISWTRL
jgi:hypothetical protein